MIAGILNNSGWYVNHKHVDQIWRREGLKVPHKEKKKGRLWMNPLGHCCAIPCRAMDGSCIRLRAERQNHVWSYDFVHERTHDGRVYRTLNIIDEYTREALMIRVDRKLNSTDVVDALTDVCILRKVHIGIDKETLEVWMVEVTSSNIGDAPMLPNLLNQTPPNQDIGSVIADGAYDTR